MHNPITNQEYLGFMNRSPSWPVSADLAVDGLCVSTEFYRFGDCPDFDEYAGKSESAEE
jgi:hypothetical protein